MIEVDGRGTKSTTCYNIENVGYVDILSEGEKQE